MEIKYVKCLSEVSFMKIRKKSYSCNSCYSQLVSIVEEASGYDIGIGKVSGAVR